MRYRVIVKATADSEAGAMPSEELIAGCTLTQMKSKEDALERTCRFPDRAIDGKEGEIEVRPLFELEDFAPGVAIERFRDLGCGRES